MTQGSHDDSRSDVRKQRAALAGVGGLGFSCIVTQLSLLREMLTVFAGNEMVLGIGMGEWLLLSGIGAWLGRSGCRFAHPLRVLACGLSFLALLPLFQIVVLRVLRDTVFLRGAEIGLAGVVVASSALLAPYCLLSGFLLPVVCRIGSGNARVARVFIADSIGSILGGLSFAFVLVRFFDHFALLAIVAVILLLGLGAAAAAFRRRRFMAVLLLLVGAVAILCWRIDVDGWSTAAQYPDQTVLWRVNSPYGKLVVSAANGQTNFYLNGYPVVASGDLARAEETVHYAMSQRPAARNVLLIGGAATGSVQEILKYPGCRVTCVEIDPHMIEAARRFVPAAVADRRVTVVNSDGRLFIARTAERFDVAIVDLPEPATTQIARFYTTEFFAVARRALTPGGVLCFQLGAYSNFVSSDFGAVTASAWRTLKQAFPNAMILPGGRLVFLASEGPLTADIAGRLEAGGIRNRLVNRHYLDAMFASDRFADIQRAVEQPARMNTDFHPVLCHYQQQLWLSQWNGHLGTAAAVLLALLGIAVFRLRPAPMAVFASGFAASSLELVLMFAFQVFHGSIYERLAWIVTAFMAGLAAGAWVTRGTARAGSKSAVRFLAGAAFAIAAFAFALPAYLRIHAQSGGFGLTPAAAEALIPALTFLLSGLAGMQFPLGAAIESASLRMSLRPSTVESGSIAASCLYTADFIGASLGAFLTGAFTIPVFGLGKTCMLAGILNAAAGVALILRRQTTLTEV